MSKRKRLNVELSIQEAKLISNLLNKRVVEMTKIQTKLNESVRKVESFKNSKEYKKEETNSKDYSLTGPKNRMLSEKSNHCSCGEATFPTPKERNIKRKKIDNKHEKIAKLVTAERVSAVNTTKIHQQDRIVNGYDANVRPWMASFVKDNKHVFCGGAVINRRYIM